jgi:hypothetical protein
MSAHYHALLDADRARRLCHRWIDVAATLEIRRPSGSRPNPAAPRSRQQRAEGERQRPAARTGGMLAFLLLLLMACATVTTPYQADVAGQRVPGGYSERQLTADRWRVTFSALPTTSLDAMERNLLRRAAELTVNNGGEWFTIVERGVDGDVVVYTSTNNRYRIKYSGGYSQWQRFWRFFRYQFGAQRIRDDPLWWHKQRPATGRMTEIHADIKMGFGTPPDDAEVHDAAALLEAIEDESPQSGRE